MSAPLCPNCGKICYKQGNVYLKYCGNSCRLGNSSNVNLFKSASVYIPQYPVQGQYLCALPYCPNAAFQNYAGCCRSHSIEANKLGLRRR